MEVEHYNTFSVFSTAIEKKNLMDIKESPYFENYSMYGKMVILLLTFGENLKYLFTVLFFKNVSK